MLQIKKIIIMNFLTRCLVAFACSLFSQAYADSFSVKIESVKKVGDALRWAVSVECVSERFVWFYVHRPDVPGKTKIQSQRKGVVTDSESFILESPSGFEGFILKRGEKNTLTYLSEMKNGALIFNSLGEKLPVVDGKTSVRINLTFWVSEFQAEKCYITNAASDWFEFNLPS